MPEQKLFRSRRAALLVGAVAALAVGYVLFTPSPSGGPSGSSYGTRDGGAAAYASLLERRGYEVHQRRLPFADAVPESGTTVVIMDVGWIEPDESMALERFVLQGGRLVVIGTDPGFVVPEDGRVVGDAIHSLRYPLDGFETIGEVVLENGRAWQDSGLLLQVIGDGNETSVGVAAWGDGWVYAVSDASILSNQALTAGDHAALGLALVGPPGIVEFAEHLHGFGPQAGFAGLPVRWQWAVGGLAVAALLFMVSRSRRLGPPPARVRDLPPPRVRYVDAMAAGLQRTGDRAGVSRVLTSEIRSRLARRGVDPDVPGALSAVATGIGLPEDEISLALGGGEVDGNMQRSARVIARLARRN